MEEITPGAALVADDLVGVARTLKRAGALGRAQEVCGVAAERGAGPEVLRVRAEVARARGDGARALSDFEALAREDGLRGHAVRARQAL